VDTFLGDSHLLADVIYHLRQTHDSQRLVQRFSLGRGDSDDLLSLARTIRETEKILARLKEQHHESLDHMVSRIVIPERLCERIEGALDEEGLVRRQRLEELETAELGKVVRRVEGQELGDEKRSKKKDDTKKDDVWIMKKSASPILKKLHDGLERLLMDKETLQQRLSEDLGTNLFRKSLC
jgi:DNA mismatch repair ATPase MutS